MSKPEPTVPTDLKDLGFCSGTTDGLHVFTDGMCRCGKSYSKLAWEYTAQRLSVLDYLRKLKARPPIPPPAARV